MSELVVDGASVESAAGAAAEAGALMRHAREGMGLRIEVLAASLKVPVAKLVALESGNLEALPDRVFVRALAASVCRHVRLDPALVLSKLPLGSQTSWANSGTAINTLVKNDHGLQRRSWRESVSRPVVLAVLALLAGAALIAFWPQLRASGFLPTSMVAASNGDVPTVQEQPAASREVELVVASAVAPPIAVASVMPVTPVPSVPTAVVAPAASELLVLRARAESWVRVIDAKNTVVFQKTLAPGESTAVSGVLPLAVTIGRADAVDVQVRGQPMELPAVAAGSVARFSVK